MEFLQSIKPEYALISCERDNYGHPHEELLKRFKDMDSRIMITYDGGAISLITDGKQLMIEEYLE